MHSWYENMSHVYDFGAFYTFADNDSKALELDSLKSILKGKRNAYFDFQHVGFVIRINFVLIPAIYTHWYRRLNFSTNFFNFYWWRIPLAMMSLLRIDVHRLYVKDTRPWKKSLSKKMDRWIIFRLKIISVLTNNDSSWSTFPIGHRFRWHEYNILFLRLND